MKDFEKQYSMLNHAQKRVVEAIYWPVMVVAWPWTWKTQIIWLRTANLIKKWVANPGNILITTFTNAGVVAIKKRLLRFIWKEAHKVNVATLHSLCQDIISDNPEIFTQYKTWRPIESIESYEILSGIFKKLHEDWKIKTLSYFQNEINCIKNCLSSISQIKQGWLTPDEFNFAIKKEEKINNDIISELDLTKWKYKKEKELMLKNTQKQKELFLIFDEYSRILKQKELYDFNDMINFVLDALKKNQSLSQDYAEKFQFIMVDEFQDTNNAQNTIIELILSQWNDKNIMVVWDDDQSIYRFQWANLENMLSFSQKMNLENVESIVLDTNYRSWQDILTASEVLIENNTQRITNKVSNLEKHFKQWNQNIKNITPKKVICKDIPWEKQFVLEKIKELSNELDYSQIAVIVRSNSEIIEWWNFLLNSWIEATFKQKSNILDSEKVILLIKSLKIFNDAFSSNQEIIDFLIWWLFDFEKIDILRINKYLYTYNYTKNVYSYKGFFEAISDEKILDEIDLLSREKVESFKFFVFEMQEILKNSSILEFFHIYIDRIWLVEKIEQSGNFDDLQDLFSLFEYIKNLLDINKNLTIAELISKLESHIDYNIEIKRQIERKSTSWVQVMTAHSSKWLEFDAVFMPSCYSKNWESKKASPTFVRLPAWVSWEWLTLWHTSKDEQKITKIEDERRLFFVWLTRAKTYLFVSIPKQKWDKEVVESTFISETQGHFYEESFESIGEEISLVNLLKPSYFSWKKQELEYIENFFENYVLSPSDLNKFIEDPLLFLKEVIFRYPFKDNLHTIFWKVYHKTLEVFYLDFKKKWILESKEFLFSKFEYYLSKAFLSPSDFEWLKEKWLLALEDYYNRISWENREILSLEHNFASENIVFSWVPITWKVDKIILNKTSDLTLIDYKTWKYKSSNALKWLTSTWDANYFRQLLFYKILCENSKAFWKYKVWTLWIDFVADKDWKNLLLELNVTQDEIDNFIYELTNSYKNMKDINFWKTLI